MIQKLIAKIQKTNAPIVVGLDPMLNYIPKHIQEKAFVEFAEQVDKSKVKVQKALDETRKLFDSLMQQYFG